ncbi:MAG: hypothetical protein RLZZ393_2113 [Pseudomonadota bacterium]|jgi:hypothetical protein
MKNVIAILLMACGLASTSQAADCGRACLKGHLDRYLDALIQHDPGKAGLGAAFRQTENAVVIPEGAGLWKSATGLGPVQRRFIDPAQSQAGFYGTLRLGDEEAVVALRLRVGNNRITQAEWFVARQRDPGMTGEAGKTPFNLDLLRSSLPVQRIVPKSERLGREDLQAIVNSYFDGITNHDGRIVKGHRGCTRYENGFPTYNTPMKPGNDIGNDGRTDCRTQADFGVALVAIRDFFVIDEEAQAVMVSAVFLREAGNPKRRNHFTELFHIDHGKIRDIHAAFHYPPDGLPVPNWPPYDGHFPLPAPAR